MTCTDRRRDLLRCRLPLDAGYTRRIQRRLQVLFPSISPGKSPKRYNIHFDPGARGGRNLHVTPGEAGVLLIFDGRSIRPKLVEMVNSLTDRLLSWTAPLLAFEA